MAVRADPARPATRRLLGRALGLFTPREWTKLGGMHGYFLTQQGVHREDVMNGVRDIETKARLEAHMDERKTGEDGYRRRIVEVRAANPAPPADRRAVWLYES